MMKTKIDINREWNKKRLPIVNGIVYKDGSVDWINISLSGNKRVIEHGSKVHLDELLSENELGFSNIIISDKIIDLINKTIVYCGEGSYGGDGFIVVELMKDSQISWIAFFENANPFEKVEVIDKFVLAYNNLGEVWRFKIDTPNDMSIQLV